MKKTTFLFCCLLASSFLFSQSIKTVKNIFLQLDKNGKILPNHGRTNINLYNKAPGNGSCSETWDTVLVGNNIDYVKYTVRERTPNNNKLSDTIISKYFELKNGIKQLTKYEKRISYSEDSDTTNILTVKLFDIDGNQTGEGTRLLVFNKKHYSSTSKNFNVTNKIKSLTSSTYEHTYFNPNSCIDSSTIVAMQGKDTIRWTSRKNSAFDNACNPLKIESLGWISPNKKVTFHEIENVTYSKNYKDVFRRYYTPAIDCDYGQVDSLHQVFFDDKSGYKEVETWYTDSTYEKIINIDRDMPLTKIMRYGNKKQIQFFYFYDKNDNLVLEERYNVINGKIDSSSVRILQDNFIEYENNNSVITYAKYNSKDNTYANYELFTKFNCKKWITEYKTISAYSINIQKTDYYDDDCSSEQVADGNFLLFPNPTSDKINIKKGANLLFDKIQIVNSLGVIVKNIEVEECDIEVETDVKDLNPGLYYLKISSQKGEKHFASKAFVKIN